MNSIPVGHATETTVSTTAQPRLVRAAHEFEAQMMKELLKPMTREGSAGQDDEDGTSGGALGEFASEALGRALSEQGGFGIANGVVHELSQTGNTGSNGKVTVNLHGDTMIRAHE